MDTSERIQILRQSGHSPQAVAAIIGVDYEEVQQYAADPSDVPAISGGGGGGDGLEPVLVKQSWHYEDPAFVPGDNSPLSFEDAYPNGAVLTGAEVDSDPTKIWLPPGVYNYYVWYSIDSSNHSGTYFAAQLNFNYDEGSGVVPPQLSVQAGEGVLGVEGDPIPMSMSYLDRNSWGVAEIPFYLQYAFGHDFTNLTGDGGFTLARVGA